MGRNYLGKIEVRNDFFKISYVTSLFELLILEKSGVYITWNTHLVY